MSIAYRPAYGIWVCITLRRPKKGHRLRPTTPRLGNVSLGLPVQRPRRGRPGQTAQRLGEALLQELTGTSPFGLQGEVLGTCRGRDRSSGRAGELRVRRPSQLVRREDRV